MIIDNIYFEVHSSGSTVVNTTLIILRSRVQTPPLMQEEIKSQMIIDNIYFEVHSSGSTVVNTTLTILRSRVQALPLVQRLDF
jgi:hypothetical protein